MAKYQKSDGWLYASINQGCDLETIIAIGDVINHAIFNYDELDEGLNRLLKNGLIRRRMGKYFKVELNSTFGKKLDKAINSSRNGVHKVTELFEKTDVQKIPNYSQHIISEEEYQEALEKYIKRFDNR